VFSALIFYKRESRLFFVSMYLLVAYLELIGTYFQCWSWPPFLLNKWPAIASANPPAASQFFTWASISPAWDFTSCRDRSCAVVTVD